MQMLTPMRLVTMESASATPSPRRNRRTQIFFSLMKLSPPVIADYILSTWRMLRFLLMRARTMKITLIEPRTNK